jgi:multidrug efflux pump subunit AcrA (membrane-fusion protein)
MTHRKYLPTAPARCSVVAAGAAALLLSVPGAAAPGRPPAPTTAPSPQTQPATGPGPGAAGVSVMGGVDAYWSADLFAKKSGYDAEVTADIGDRVAKVQVMAVIDVPELDRELAAARAGLAAKRELAKAAEAAVQQAQTGLEVAKRQAEGARAEQRLMEATLKRQEELFADQAATSQQIDEARAKAEVARSTAAVDEAKIAAAEADLRAAQAHVAVADANAEVAAAEAQRVETMAEYRRIVAPFDGVVTRRQVSPGDLVQSGAANRAAPLFTVQRIDTVRVMCDVPEANAAAVAVGDPAEVKLFGQPSQTVRGAVTRVATALNPATRTMRVEIDLPNPQGRLRPGMYAQVMLTPGQPRAATETETGAPPATR